MKRSPKVEKPVETRPVRPPLSPEAVEGQMISMAMDLARQQLQDGTASSQVITHFLKLGSMRERLETEILEKQRDLVAAKTEQLKSQKRVEEMYAEALKAMRRYSGSDVEEDDYEGD